MAENGDSTDIGRKWIGSVEHGIVGMGVICAVFHWLGTVDCAIDVLYKNSNGSAMNFPVSFMNQGGIASKLVALSLIIALKSYDSATMRR